MADVIHNLALDAGIPPEERKRIVCVAGAYDSLLFASFSGVGVTPVCGRTAARCDDFACFDLRFLVSDTSFFGLLPTGRLKASSFFAVGQERVDVGKRALFPYGSLLAFSEARDHKYSRTVILRWLWPKKTL